MMYINIDKYLGKEISVTLLSGQVINGEVSKLDNQEDCFILKKIMMGYLYHRTVARSAVMAIEEMISRTGDL